VAPLIKQLWASHTCATSYESLSSTFDAQWKRVETEVDYLANLKPNVNIVLSDFALPQFSTPRALALLQQSKLDIPFIIVSGTIGEERAVEIMKAGATDYVLKEHLHRVGPVVQRALRRSRKIKARAWGCRPAERFSNSVADASAFKACWAKVQRSKFISPALNSCCALGLPANRGFIIAKPR
jgi:DNA-binding NtrC family response regulator